MKIAVFSDLHYGSRRYSQQHMPRLRSILSGVNYGIANGDIIQIASPNGERRDYDTSAEEGAILNRSKKNLPGLIDLCHAAPNTRMCYVNGNHDGYPYYSDLIDNWHPQFPQKPKNLSYYRKGYLLFGNMLFIHGDQIFDVVAKHSKPNEVEECCKAAQKLKSFCSAQGIDYRSIDHVFTGHTHRAFSNIVVDGITFHNSGSFSLDHGNGAIFVVDIEMFMGTPCFQSLSQYYLKPSQIIHKCYDYDESLTNIFIEGNEPLHIGLMRDPQHNCENIRQLLWHGHCVSVTTYKNPRFEPLVRQSLKMIGLSEHEVGQVIIDAEYNLDQGKNLHIQRAWDKHKSQNPALMNIKPLTLLTDDRDENRDFATRVGHSVINPLKYGYLNDHAAIVQPIFQSVPTGIYRAA